MTEKPMGYRWMPYQSPIGGIALCSNGEALVGLWIEGQKHYGAGILDRAEQVGTGDDAVLDQVAAWLDRYFAGSRPDINELPLAPIGSEFRQLVWKFMKEVPYGQTVTYGDIARKVAQAQGKGRTSNLAVGGAVAYNPITVILPCHRVVGADGSLTGYAGGLDRKIWLLQHEGAVMDGLYRPTKGTAL